MDWKEQLKQAYDVMRDKQKAAKPKIKSAFDDEINYKGRAGFNDAGIPLSPTTIKKKSKNRSMYSARARAKYYAAGSQLRNINERRKADAAVKYGVKEQSSDFKIPDAVSPVPRVRFTFADTLPSPTRQYYDPIKFDDSIEVVPSTGNKYSIDEEPKFRNKIEEQIYRLKKK